MILSGLLQAHDPERRGIDGVDTIISSHITLHKPIAKPESMLNWENARAVSFGAMGAAYNIPFAVIVVS